MKKFLSLLISAALLMSTVPMLVAAEAEESWQTFAYKQDGPAFSVEATDFTPDGGSYKFLAAAYNAEGKMIDVKTDDATVTDGVLSASINFEEGDIEADVSIDSVKTMLWNSFEGLHPITEEGVFDIDAQTKDENGVLSSLTNGFYEVLPVEMERYSNWTQIENGAFLDPGIDDSKIVTGATDGDLTTYIGYSSTGDNRFNYIMLEEATQIDRVVTYTYDDPTTVPDPRQAGTEYYLTDYIWGKYEAPYTELMSFWTALTPATTVEGVHYLGTSESMARFPEDADAKLVYDVPEDAGAYQYVFAKKSTEVGGRTYELQAYKKVTQTINLPSDRPEINVATNAAAFAYGNSNASYAVDGSLETTWTSLNNTELNDYLILDLGTAYSISSIKATMPEGVAQNFTVYGANDAKQTDKTALTGAVIGLAADAEADLGAILSAEAFRYIIFEQAAAETIFGFAEIKVNTQERKAADHAALGAVVPLSSATCFAEGKVDGYTGSASNKTNAQTNLLDGNPTTTVSATGGKNPAYSCKYFFDLGEGNAKTLTHIAYQANPDSSTNVRFTDKILFVASNDPYCYKLTDAETSEELYDVLAEMGELPRFVTGSVSSGGDTGLLVFEVPAELQNTAYRYVGIIKTENTLDQVRLGASTLQFYTKDVAEPEEPEIVEVNVATNAAAFAYGNSNASYAVDGSLETIWTSLNNTELNDYLILDLGTAYSISSIKATMPEGVAQNFTVYGANDAKQTDKTALTGAVIGLTAGAEADLGAILSAEAFRYIIFEQAAAETSFGFAEIKVNTQERKAADHAALGAVVPLTSATCFAEGKVNGYTGNASNKTNAQTNLLDGNPTTTVSATGGKNPAYSCKYFFDLGEGNAKTLTHVAYQANPTTGTEVRFTDKILFVASNDPNCYKLTDAETSEELYDVLAEMGELPRFVTGSVSSGGDTGLLVFEVPAELQNTAYRYVGIIKTENTLDQVRLGASTLQFYTKDVEEPEEPEIAEVNVATNAAAFAYGNSNASYAVDGSLETTWTSLNNTELNDYLILDLGTAYSISSIKATMPEGVAQNFTVYGANDAKQTDKTALTGAVNGLVAGAEADLGAILSAEAFRYIIFEQAAAETSFGFAEIKVNTQERKATDHAALGAVVPLTSATCFAEGKVDGYTGSASNKTNAQTNLLDGNPTTTVSATGGKDPAYSCKYFFDLGEGNAKTLTHVAYQANPTTGTQVRFTDKILFVASNDPNCYKLTDAETSEELYDVLAEMGELPRFVTGSVSSGGDTGLLVFEVPAELQNTAYRYVGIIKTENTLDQVRLGASTLQFYTKDAE